MNFVMNEELTLIRKLQGLDLRAAELEKEIASLPKHIAEIEKILDSHKRRLEMDRAALTANQKERRSLELEVQTQEQKISKLRDQMLSAKTNEQYRAFQHEIEYCEGQIRKFEDRILDLMAESEPLEGNVKAAEKSLAEEAKQVEAEKKVARERTDADRRQLEIIQAERKQVAATLSKPSYNTYERLRRRAGGVAVAEAVDDQCSACHMSIRPQMMQDLRKGSDELLFCENCKRILYWNPPVSFEHEIA